MLNRVMLIGALGQDPETRFFPSGDQQTTVSLATSRRWKDKQTGERKEKTTWHNLVFNRGLAKVAAEYLKKGSKIYVSGEIDNQSWEKDGQKHYKTVISVTEMHMLDSRNGGSSSEPGNGANQSSGSGAASYDDYNDDIPFASLNWQIRRHLI